jgi:hypothetical protein
MSSVQNSIGNSSVGSKGRFSFSDSSSSTDLESDAGFDGIEFKSSTKSDVSQTMGPIPVFVDHPRIGPIS